jgi:hypothetical protein
MLRLTATSVIRRRCAPAVAIALLTFAAAPPAAAQPSRWTIAERPVFSVGDAEGDSTRDLLGVTSAVRLPNGDVVVANGRYSNIRWYDARGRLLRTIGRRGSGPREFGRSLFLYAKGDTVVAQDIGNRRWHYIDSRGEFVRTDTLGDRRRGAWLYDRTLITRLPDGVDLSRAMSAIAAAPFVAGDSVRTGVLSPSGVLWLTDPQDSLGLKVHGPDGRLLGTVHLPPRFQLLQVMDTLVLGRWRDEDDIEYVQIRSIDRGTAERGSRTRPAPARPAYDQAAELAKHAMLLTRMRAVARNILVMQETYFSDHNRYAPSASQLKVDLPDGIRFSLLQAQERSYLVLVEHPSTRVTCAIVIGGLPGGAVDICG